MGDVIEIETDTGEKVKFTIMGMIEFGLKEYEEILLYVPQELLSVMRPNTSNFNSQYLLDIDMEHISEPEDSSMGCVEIIKLCGCLNATQFYPLVSCAIIRLTGGI